MRLTDLAIRQLKYDGTQKTYYDDVLPGFGIRVGSRTKAYVAKYGRERRLKTLGHYPELPLSAARNAARDVLYAKMPQSSNLTFAAARAAFLAESEAKHRHNTFRNYRIHLNKIDVSGSIADVSRLHLRSILSQPHTLTAFKVFFNWCLRNEFINKNPLHADKAKYQPPKERVLSTDELVQIWGVLDDSIFSSTVRLLILTGQRRAEVAHITNDGTTATIHSGHTKNKRTHTFPVPQLAIDYLPAPTFQGWSKAKARLDILSGVTDWTLHDLRRTYATIHAQIGTPIHVIEKLLNHVSGSLSGVAGIYNRYTYMDEMREAVQKYEDWIISKVLKQVNP